MIGSPVQEHKYATECLVRSMKPNGRLPYRARSFAVKHYHQVHLKDEEVKLKEANQATTTMLSKLEVRARRTCWKCLKFPRLEVKT